MSDYRNLKTLVFGMTDRNNKKGRYCSMVQRKSARSKPLSIGVKELAEDGRAGIRC